MCGREAEEGYMERVRQRESTIERERVRLRESQRKTRWMESERWLVAKCTHTIISLSNVQ